MKIETLDLWKHLTGGTAPKIAAYIPEDKKTNSAVIIFPGGGYKNLAPHEGADYAVFLAEQGITSFVVTYRVAPNKFPLPLLDARRAVQFVRYYSKNYGLDKDKIAIMGSSAGGHLSALTCTCFDKFDLENEDDIDKESYLPNAQILCYPVIKLLGKATSHLGSGKNLLGELHAEMGEQLSPDLIADERAPQAFIWHTAEDNVVHVFNSIDYAKRLKSVGVPVELHIFPNGNHGMGLAKGEEPKRNHIAQWKKLLLEWLKYIGF